MRMLEQLQSLGVHFGNIGTVEAAAEKLESIACYVTGENYLGNPV